MEKTVGNIVLKKENKTLVRKYKKVKPKIIHNDQKTMRIVKAKGLTLWVAVGVLEAVRVWYRFNRD